MTDIRVLILTDHSFSPPGGAERYANTIVKELLKVGVDVYALNMKNVKENINYFYNPSLEKYIKDYLLKIKPDVAQLSVLNPQYAYLSMTVLRRYRIPYITTVHSYAHICPTEFFVRLPGLTPCKKPYPNLHCMKCLISKAKLVRITKYISRLVGGMIYNMNVYRKFLKDSYLTISPSKMYAKLLSEYSINVVHMWHPLKIPDLSLTSKCGDGGSVIFVGRHEWEKGVHIVLGLAKRLRNVKFKIVGKGRLTHWLLSHRLPNIVYYGFVSDLKKYKLIAESSVVIVPSIWCDIFNYVVSEALALAKPVVAFDLCGPKEQIEYSKGGLLATSFNINDFVSKVRYLLENPNEAKKLGVKGKQWVRKNLTPNRYVKKLMKIYDHAMEGKRV